MDLLFDCSTCAGPLVACETERAAPRQCPHCMVRVFVPASARSGRCSALLRDSEIMAVCVPGAARPRTLRRVRPAAMDSARSIIATSARVVPPPLPLARTAQAA